jgi:hypothetical protein
MKLSEKCEIVILSAAKNPSFTLGEADSSVALLFQNDIGDER